MALEVEDGTGKTNAESYISVADATARHAAFGNAAWANAASDTVREAALRQGTAYMLQAYRNRWLGFRLSIKQSLDWPRVYVIIDENTPVPTDSVPTDIANACADLALRALASDLNADLARGVVRKKIGPLETEYDPYSPQATRFRAIDMMLAPYLKGSSANAQLVRA